MLQLIVKDMLILKKTLLLGLFYIILMVVAMQSSGTAMLPAGVMALTYILVMTACAYEDKSKADVLLNSLPLGRSSIVMAKYLSVFVYAALGVIYYMLVTGIINAAGIPLRTYPVTPEGLGGALFAVSFIISIYFPAFFKMGYIRSKFINFIMFFVIFFGIGAFAVAFNAETDSALVSGIKEFLSGLSEFQAVAGLLAIILLLLAGSYLLSVRFYKSREF